MRTISQRPRTPSAWTPPSPSSTPPSPTSASPSPSQPSCRRRRWRPSWFPDFSRQTKPNWRWSTCRRRRRCRWRARSPRTSRSPAPTTTPPSASTSTRSRTTCGRWTASSAPQSSPTLTTSTSTWMTIGKQINYFKYFAIIGRLYNLQGNVLRVYSYKSRVFYKIRCINAPTKQKTVFIKLINIFFSSLPRKNTISYIKLYLLSFEY